MTEPGGLQRDAVPKENSGVATTMAVNAGGLAEWIEQVLSSNGVASDAAATIADCLVSADMKGVASHGVARLPVYLSRLKQGIVNPDPAPTVVSESGAVVLIDADGGFGHPVAAFGMRTAIDRARTAGAAAVGIRNSTHFGMAGYYAEMAAREDAIGIVTTNSAPRMAPWGGKDAVLGTNPLAIAVPRVVAPIVLDMATSVAALGRILIAAAGGSTIPEGWALDEDGHPTTDPKAALIGTLAPVGGPKGSGLAFMLDILCGVLTGGAFGLDVRSLYRDPTMPERCGHFMLVIDVNAFVPIDVFRAAIERYVTDFKASSPVADSGEIFLPGEIQQRLEHQARSDGIIYDSWAFDDLRRIAEDSGIQLPTTTSVDSHNEMPRSVI